MIADHRRPPRDPLEEYPDDTIELRAAPSGYAHIVRIRPSYPGGYPVPESFGLCGTRPAVGWSMDYPPGCARCRACQNLARAYMRARASMLANGSPA